MFSDSIKHTQKHIKQFCKLSKKTLRDRAKKEKLNSWITELRVELVIVSQTRTTEFNIVVLFKGLKGSKEYKEVKNAHAVLGTKEVIEI